MRIIILILLLAHSLSFIGQEYVVDSLPSGRLSIATLPDSVDVQVGLHYRRIRVPKSILQGVVDWVNILSKPSLYPPANHAHPISDVTNLQTSLNGKANSSHTHVSQDITGLSTVATSGSYNDLSNRPPIPSLTSLSADVTNNNGTANTIADVTALSFSVVANTTYKFKFFIVYTAAATTTGSRWSINGPATTFLHYNSEYSLTVTSKTFNEGLSGYNLPAASNATSAATGSNIAIIEGIIRPSANGTVIARFASEVASSAIVAKGGRSYVEYSIMQ